MSTTSASKIAEPDGVSGLANDINTLTTTGYFKASESLHIRRFANTKNLQLRSDHPVGGGEIFIPIDDVPALIKILDELYRTRAS